MGEVIGPNVKRLLSLYIARIAIPDGGGIDDGFRFFTDSEHMRKVVEQAEENCREAINVVRSAPDNPFANDEEIAGEILRRVDAVKQKK